VAAHKIQLTSADSFNMVFNYRQDYPGRFAVKEDITTLSKARNNLALKTDWKPEPVTVKNLSPKDSTVLDAFYGPIGPQIDLKSNMFLPGDLTKTQYELLYPKGTSEAQRLNFLEIISEHDLK
jgi:hypothetical protein